MTEGSNKEIRAELYRLINLVNRTYSSNSSNKKNEIDLIDNLVLYFNRNRKQIHSFINEQDENGHTLLHKAVLIKGKHSIANIITALLDIGANPLIIDNNSNIARDIICEEQYLLNVLGTEELLKITRERELELIAEHVKDDDHLSHC